MAGSNRRRSAESSDLDDKGRAVFRFDKARDGSRPVFVTAREGTTKYDRIMDTPGWERVPASERDEHDAEAAAARHDQAREARDAEQERLNRRYGVTDTMVDARATTRGRGRPSNVEKAAVERADQLSARNADLEAEIAELRKKLEASDGDAAKGADA